MPNRPDDALHETCHLLVIDDDLIQRTIISKIGSQVGFEVTAVSTLAHAADVLMSAALDCVTLDLSLGTQSGASLLQTVAESGQSTPVLIISGAEPHVLKSTLAAAASLGLDAQALTKPLDLALLRHALTAKMQAAPTVRDLQRIRSRARAQKRARAAE